MFPGWQPPTPGHQICVEAVLWEIPLFCSVAEGEHKDGAHWLEQAGGGQRWHLPKTKKKRERKNEEEEEAKEEREEKREGERREKKKSKEIKRKNLKRWCPLALAGQTAGRWFPPFSDPREYPSRPLALRLIFQNKETSLFHIKSGHFSKGYFCMGP